MEELTEEVAKACEEEGERLIESFKLNIKKSIEQILDGVYVDLMPHILSDAWLNYRNVLRHELEREYFSSTKWIKSEELWAKGVRKALYKEYSKELTDARVKDLEETIKVLKEDLTRARNLFNRY